jgi:hypothetical protein
MAEAASRRWVGRTIRVSLVGEETRTKASTGSGFLNCLFLLSKWERERVIARKEKVKHQFSRKKEKKIKNREKDLSYYSDMLLDYFLSFDPLFSIAMQFLTPIFHLRHTYVFSK